MTLVPCPSQAASGGVRTAVATAPLPPQTNSGPEESGDGVPGSRQGKVSGLAEPEAGGAERSHEYPNKFGRTLLSAAP